LKGIGSAGALAAMSGFLPGLSFAYTPPVLDPQLVELRRRAARLANYATFGANEDTVGRIIDIGWEAWVDEQLALLPTPLYPSATLTTTKPTTNQFYSAW
jgi:hypothetical protein